MADILWLLPPMRGGTQHAVTVSFQWQTFLPLVVNPIHSIVFRAFQGIGGSGLYSLAQIGLYEIGPSNKPSLLGALIGAALALAFVLGPILGGTISKLATWRWIFYIK
jgi:MFS family permease